MRLGVLGQSGIEASVVGLGTWAIGGGPFWGPTDDAESIRAIQAALDAGITLIDTAPVYGFGHSEEIVGRAIKGRRKQVVLATKCGLWWDDETGTVFFKQLGRTVRRSLDPRTIRIEVDRSLRRLGTDHIDLIQTHWQAVEPVKVPIADTMGCLLRLEEEGKVRAIGASNATAAELDAYRAVGPLDACQPRYSILDRRIETELLPHCRKNDIATLLYSPLEQGLLTGKLGMDYKPAEEEYRNLIPWFAPPARKRVLAMLDGWKDLTARHRCTLAELAIAWVLAQPGATHALCGARKASHVAENVRAGDLVLPEADLARMRRDAEALGSPTDG